jgi:hypothetical protein
MSILRPHRKRHTIWFSIALIAVLLASGVIYVGEYQSFARARGAVVALQEEIVMLETANVDLTQAVFAATNPRVLTARAVALGLSLDRQPMYLAIGTGSPGR